MSARIIALSTAGLAAATVGLARIVGRAEKRQAAPPAPEPAPRPPAPEPAAELVPPPPPGGAVAAAIAAANAGDVVSVRGARGRFVKRNPPAAVAT